ncbi:MAG: SUMF1/EgtB/PvdO family nonheme iron enzyme [Myxococcaceae bacterium]|nr:SUMF1/EgtB/PvdO family nonheme iron enzyme [Myxococcaceae bacterium]
MRSLLLVTLLASSAFAQWPSLAVPLAPQGGGEKDAALLVSLETYAFLPGIPGAKENAAAWFQHLVKTRGVPVTQVTWLQNTEAALESIRKELKATVAKVKPGGMLWVVFIGHGAPSEDGSDGLLVGADAQNVMESFAARSLKRSELLATLESGQQSASVVLLDACFSGQSPTGELLVKGVMPTLPERETQLTAKKPVVVLSAGTSRQVAGALPGKDVPAFSYLALGGLRGWADENHDGKVTAGEVVGFSRSVMGTTLTGRTQTPTLNPESAVNVVVGKAKAGEELPLSDVVLWLKGAAGGTKASLAPAPEVRAPGPMVTSGGVKAVVGSLTVKTTPTGARLDLVDPKGQALATRAPLVKSDAMPGRWKVTATLDGYVKQTRDIEVPADDVAIIELALQKPASLEVVGTPEGAQVKVTGPEGFQNEGGLPWKAEGLTPGEYVVSISREGYSTEEWRGVVAAGKAQQVMRKLQRARVALPAEATLQPGTTRLDSRTGITWVWMPAGTFEQGCVPSDKECRDDEKPVVTKTVTGFWMAKTETTVKQYEACVAEGRCTAAQSGIKSVDQHCNSRQRLLDRHAGSPDDHPVNCVNWEQATTFCEWAAGRLPSGTEWEYAAKSGQPVIFPWGNSRPPGKARFASIWLDPASGKTPVFTNGTFPVGSYPAGVSAWGLMDMAGNVSEWTATSYGMVEVGVGDWRSKMEKLELRGGGWRDGEDVLRASLRVASPSLADGGRGFRCAQ